jgi:hypothetical protein
VLFIAGAAAAATVSGAGPLQIGTTTTVLTTTAATTTATTTTTTVVTPPPRRRATLCHHTRVRRNPHRTIVVRASVARAHLRHGDTTGSCNSARNLRRHSTSAHVRRFHRHTTLRAEFRREKRRGGG